MQKTEYPYDIFITQKPSSYLKNNDFDLLNYNRNTHQRLF